jgi:3',5'-cyclic AMP phosphodiesterase CpdA
MSTIPRIGRYTLCAVAILTLSLILMKNPGSIGFAQDVLKLGKAVPEKEAHRTTAIPDRIILNWEGDPAQSQAVTWRTDSSVTKAFAQFTLADPNGRQMSETASTREATTTPLVSDLGTAHYHSVNLTNLKPDSQYAYRVGDGTNWSEWFHFRTASDRAKPFSFIYFGDAQNDVKSLWSRVIRGAYSEDTKARFIIHAGDLINRANRDAEWGEWFGAGGWVNGMVPSLSTPGNHEYEKGVLSRHWRPQFTQPTNGPVGLEETVFTLDYQGVRFISLNSNEKQAAQVEWLEKALKENRNKWTIVTFHHPIFSSAKGRDNAALRNLWKPLFDKYRVDLVLQGHDHTYARSNLSNLNSGVNGMSAEGGTVYVVSVSGPKTYNLDREVWMQRAAEDTQLYQIISIKGDLLRYEARTATGDLYDAFDLIKQRGTVNRIEEKIPVNVPERLRKKPNGVQ